MHHYLRESQWPRDALIRRLPIGGALPILLGPAVIYRGTRPGTILLQEVMY